MSSSSSAIPTAECCATPIPASSIVLESAQGYQPKGKVIQDFIPGVRAYWTGPEKAKAAIVHVYDIWGFEPKQSGCLLVLERVCRKSRRRILGLCRTSTMEVDVNAFS
jgi:hypothetical protein